MKLKLSVSLIAILALAGCQTTSPPLRLSSVDGVVEHLDDDHTKIVVNYGIDKVPRTGMFRWTCDSGPNEGATGVEKTRRGARGEANAMCGGGNFSVGPAELKRLEGIYIEAPGSF